MNNMSTETFEKLVLEQLAELSKGQRELQNDVSNIKGQLEETNQITRSLLHRTEELDAKFDGLLHNTASKDSIAHLESKMERMAGDINFLVRKAAEHEDDIRNLRLIK